MCDAPVGPTSSFLPPFCWTVVESTPGEAVVISLPPVAATLDPVVALGVSPTGYTGWGSAGSLMTSGATQVTVRQWRSDVVRTVANRGHQEASLRRALIGGLLPVAFRAVMSIILSLKSKHAKHA